MRARNILFILTLVCGLTAVIGVTANYLILASTAKKDSQRDAENVVASINQDLEALLEGFRVQVAIQSEVSDVRSYLSGDAQDKDLTPLLNHICQVSKSSLCYLLNPEGIMVVANDFPEKSFTVGKDYSFRPYFREAITQGSALQLAVGASTLRRGLYFSHRVDSEAGAFLGVVVNKFPPERLEDEFKQLDGIVILLDPKGTVFASNRTEWVLKGFPSVNNRNSGELKESYAGNQVPIRWSDSETLEDINGSSYQAYVASVESLPGWTLLYLDDQRLSLANVLGNQVLYLMTGITLLIAALVFALYRQGSKQIERRILIESELRHSEARLIQLSEVAGEAIIMHQGDKIIDYNKATERLFHCHERELKNRSLLALFNPQGRDEIEQLYSHGEFSFECDAMRLDGTEFSAIVNYQQSYIDNEYVGISCIQDITVLKEHEKRVLYQAQFDALTNLPNRTLMGERLEKAITEAQANNKLLSLLFLDLDDFKWVNDSLGHEEGDALLIQVASRLRAILGDKHTLGRYGGDEFIILLENQDDLYLTEEVAHNLLSALSREFRVIDRSYFISGSIGIAVAPRDGIVPDEILRKADTAMYRVKEEGRNGFRFYTPEMNRDIENRLEIAGHLRHALERNELSLHYHPIMSVEKGEVYAVEALLRWNNPVLGQVSPDQFIPVAEQTGLILPIGDWIIREACSKARYWQTELGLGFKIGVNVSPVQFRDGHIVSALLNAFDETGFQPENMVVEITEGLLINNDEETSQTLNQIRAMGVGIAMDDFGTGYSSLSYLKQFPFTSLKIDRSFVRDLEDDQGDQELVSAAITLAKGLGLRVIAEGVEDEYQCDFLIHNGCDALQGFYFSRPVPADELGDVLEHCNELLKTVIA